MRKDSELAKLDFITPNDIKDKPLIISTQELLRNELAGLFGESIDNLNVVTTFTFLFNTRLMVEENIGYAFTLENLYPESEINTVCFKPLYPTHTIKTNVI